jgi:hypothetical protein
LAAFILSISLSARCMSSVKSSLSGASCPNKQTNKHVMSCVLCAVAQHSLCTAVGDGIVSPLMVRGLTCRRTYCTLTTQLCPSAGFNY